MKRFFTWRNGKKLIYFMMLALLVVVAFTFARRSADPASFHPLNGDFQNYNGFNRLLNGQVPFRDFAFYLGFGVLFSNSFLLAMIGNTFVNSLFATAFLSALSFLLTVYILLYVLSKNHYVAMIFTCLMGVFAYGYEFSLSVFSENGLGFLVRPFIWLYDFFGCFVEHKNTGNSLRGMRVLVVVLVALLALIINRLKDTRAVRAVRRLNYAAKSALVGVVGGAVILWSNDFGLAAYGALAISLFLWLCLAKKAPVRVVLGSLSYVGASIAGLFLLLCLFTAGHPMQWVKNVAGVSGYQFWYYGNVPGIKALRLWDLPPFSGVMTIPLLMAIGLLVLWIVKLIRNPKHSVFDYAKVFLMSAFLIGGYFYCIKSGLDTTVFYPAIQLTYVAVLCFGFSLIQKAAAAIKKVSVKKVFRAAVAVVCCVCVLFGAYFSYAMNKRENIPDASAFYVPELGGNVVTYYKSLEESRYVFSEGTLFSTYAGAIEVMRGQFQPSRYDYIIHVLGDDARAEYLESYRESTPTYISAIRWDFSNWETWCLKANWFFYREFYQDYRPFYANEYAVYYEKSADINMIDPSNINVTQTKIDAATTEIVVEMPGRPEPAIVDLKLQYESGYTPARWKNAAINRAVMLESFDPYLEGYHYLPADTVETEVYIPVVVVNGVGRVLISSNPTECTALEFQQADVMGAFDFWAVTYNSYNDLNL